MSVAFDAETKLMLEGRVKATLQLLSLSALTIVRSRPVGRGSGALSPMLRELIGRRLIERILHLGDLALRWPLDLLGHRTMGLEKLRRPLAGMLENDLLAQDSGFLPEMRLPAAG
jgi:hypothetical protein